MFCFICFKIIFIFTAGGLFEGGLFDDAPMGDVPPVDSHITDPVPAASQDSDDDDDIDNFGGPPSVGGHRYFHLHV